MWGCCGKLRSSHSWRRCPASTPCLSPSGSGTWSALRKTAQLHIFDSVLTLFMLYGHCCKSQGGQCEIIMTFFGTVRKSNCRFNSSFLLKSAQQCHEGDFEIALKYTWPPFCYPTFTNFIIFLNMEDGWELCGKVDFDNGTSYSSVQSEAFSTFFWWDQEYLSFNLVFRDKNFFPSVSCFKTRTGFSFFQSHASGGNLILKNHWCQLPIRRKINGYGLFAQRPLRNIESNSAPEKKLPSHR